MGDWSDHTGIRYWAVHLFAFIVVSVRRRLLPFCETPWYSKWRNQTGAENIWSDIQTYTG
jgi:hypothetical protein